jgi:hypothetical protein
MIFTQLPLPENAEIINQEIVEKIVVDCETPPTPQEHMKVHPVQEILRAKGFFVYHIGPKPTGRKNGIYTFSKSRTVIMASRVRMKK